MTDAIDLQSSLTMVRSGMEAFAPIPEEEWRHLLPMLSLEAFPESEYLVRAEELSTHFYFLVYGLVRLYYLTEDGKEFNKNFAVGGALVGSFQGLVLHQPSGYFIQALERTEAIALPIAAMVAGYDRHPCWERIGRRCAEQLALQKEAREKEFLLDSLEVRYTRLLREFPGLLERIPHYHIASYLGVTNVALSRMRKKIRLA
jgi:CRP-like cAMP-binding protein